MAQHIEWSIPIGNDVDVIRNPTDAIFIIAQRTLRFSKYVLTDRARFA